MTGSIACYKACSVISSLHQKGFSVQVVMSAASLNFVGAATIEGLTGRTPVTDMYAAGSVMDHIHLVRWADLILVAPATANYINKMAAGIGDDLLTTLFLAHDFKKPFLIAPAMNTMMYMHPIVQNSIQKLRQLGVEILETASGVLACGEIGSGKLLDPVLIVQEVEKKIANISDQQIIPTSLQDAKKIKVLITAGGTTEPIDDVRVITNKSTGRTAAYVADQLIESGFEVYFLHSENSAQPKLKCAQLSFSSFKDLQASLQQVLSDQSFDWVIHAAAVSDYSVQSQAGKISSEASEINIKMIKNKKLINEIKKISPQTKIVGFKLTSGAEAEVRQAKVQNLFSSSHCEFVIHNDWTQMTDGQHPFNFFKPDLSYIELKSKQELGFQLFKTLSAETI